MTSRVGAGPIPLLLPSTRWRQIRLEADAADEVVPGRKGRLVSSLNSDQRLRGAGGVIDHCHEFNLPDHMCTFFLFFPSASAAHIPAFCLYAPSSVAARTEGCQFFDFNAISVILFGSD